MKTMLIVVLIGTLLAGCSSASATQAVSTGNRDIASVATEGQITEEAPTPAPGEVVMTVNPTPLALVPIQGQPPETSLTPVPGVPADWQTYANATLGIQVAYPPDWSMTEQNAETTFTSPQGATILLKAVAASSAGNEMRTGNLRCTSRTNANNLTAEICVDSASFSYSAKFSELPVALITTTRAAGTVFESMFNSLQMCNKISQNKQRVPLDQAGTHC
jgi:hypothetical protein